MKNKGFTLVELLITIAIIGILASMVLPRLFGPTEQGRSAEARNMLGAIRQAQEAFRVGPNGAYLDMVDPDNNGMCTDLENTDTNGFTAWQQLGIADPNAGNTFFGYCTFANPANPAEFLIVASRDENNDATLEVMCLNQNGIWSGNYSQIPFNANGNCTPGNWDCC